MIHQPSRYDLVFVFDRPTGRRPICGFAVVAQQLLAGDIPNICEPDTESAPCSPILRIDERVAGEAT
jgi:hypothetical protein